MGGATNAEVALLVCFLAVAGELADAGLIEREAICGRIERFGASDEVTVQILEQIVGILRRSGGPRLTGIDGGKAG